MITVTVLGSGASLGCPVIGCKCAVCLSQEIKNKRLRSAILITNEVAGVKKNVLIDCGFDIKQQLINAGVQTLEAVIITHSHADHVSGIDELRIFSRLNNANLLPLYMTLESKPKIAYCYDYMFTNKHLEERIIDYYDTITVAGMQIAFFKQDHVVMDSLGLRIKNFVYANDVAFFYPQSHTYLENMDTFLVDCCAYQSTKVHAGLERVLSWHQQFQPKTTYLTNLSHEIDYLTIQKSLATQMYPAYDNLTFAVI
jgi:phosphoribosyl 1,2-cyclic phosphate phosphodiesterase